MHTSEKIYEILESICELDFPEEIPKNIESLSYKELANFSGEIARFHKQNFQAVLHDLKNNTKEFWLV